VGRARGGAAARAPPSYSNLSPVTRHLTPAQIPAFINPGAGGADEVRAGLAAEPSITVHEMAPNRLAEALRDAVAGGARRVVVSGGDGTIGSAAAVLAGTPVELAVIPGGTLNHFARSVGIPDNVHAAIAVALGSVVRTVDVAFVNDRLILSTSSVGVYTLFVRTRDRFEPRCGYWLASLVAMVRVLARLVTLTVELDIGDARRRYRSPLLFVAVGERELRMPKLGGRVHDGRRGLHVMVVRGAAGARLVAVALAAVARGTRYAARLPHLDTFMVERCTVSVGAPRISAGVDGEIVTLDTPLHYRFVPDALRVVVPY
jgi:diacylglycerol kinase family enzyme